MDTCRKRAQPVEKHDLKEILPKNGCIIKQFGYHNRVCGRSSVVERHVANVNVVSSSLIARFFLAGGHRRIFWYVQAYFV